MLKGLIFLIYTFMDKQLLDGLENLSEAKKNNEALIEWLENVDDIDEVYHNLEL